jgi:hypothetical protein
MKHKYCCSPGADVEVATRHGQHPVKALLRGQVDIALLTTAEVPKSRPGTKRVDGGRVR